MASPAVAGYSESQRWFEALSPLDRAIVQANLVLTGNYDGLIDATFGPGTYKAIVKYQVLQSAAADGVLSPAEASHLADTASTIYRSLGIAEVDDTDAGIAVFLPRNLLTGKSPTKRGTAYTTAGGLLDIETIRMPAEAESFAELFHVLSTSNSARHVSYANWGNAQFSISGALNGRYFYTRFYNDGGASVGYSLTWDRRYNNTGSMLAIFMASFSYPLSQAPGPEAGAAQQRDIASTPHADDSVEVGMGSGFFFGSEGMIATNYHVAGSCLSITVTGYGSATLIKGDEKLDLAAIQVDSHKSGPVVQISTRPPELAQSVVLLGYPLADLLDSSLNVSTGIVSAENGLGGDPNWFTTNAGIALGNSGGPILDDHGNVLGIAVAKINDAKLLETLGTTAPNVGFAIKDTTLLQFLSIFRHREAALEEGPALSVQEVVRRVRNSTVQIVCQEAPTTTAGNARPG
jgi:S1-C subfamily serine protease